ncbi:hypothetical protein U1701_17555 [Sphingomonas sp. PB2P19]|uniref:hypothetical protein n=1 Tax=Sphingomonas rhamnosi TaxID=3096156 RepID=UPI002FC6EE60
MRYVLCATLMLVSAEGMAHPGRQNVSTSLVPFPTRLFPESGWRSVHPSADDGKICLTRKRNGAQECRTRASWEKVAFRLRAKADPALPH